jgi:hypothetical protein
MPLKVHDAVLTAILIVQSFTLFVAAPFGALDYSVLTKIAEFLTLAYVLLIVLIAQSRMTAIIAFSVASSAWPTAFSIYCSRLPRPRS